MGVDLCGFVTEYPVEVPWNVSREQCGELMRAAIPPVKSCIVTGGSREQILDLALALKPNLVQLHFRETLEDTACLVRTLAPHGIGIIKTIPTSASERLRQFGAEDVETCVKKLCEAGVYAVLIDSREPSNAADRGVKADLSLCCRVKAAAGCPVMVGGGITHENCREVIEEVAPEIMDVMTGVERCPGVKSAELLSKLCNAINGDTSGKGAGLSRWPERPVRT